MSNDKSIHVDTTEVRSEDASEQPTTHQSPSPGESLPQWPTYPHPLNPPRKSEMLQDAFDFSLIAVTVALIVKAALCVVASHIDRENRGYSIDEASATFTISDTVQPPALTTIFTIIFSLIITTLFRRVALFRAQEGTATIAELEQYQASSSLPGALKAMWSLRSFTYVSLYLISCWFWYYLGSQATTYEYELVNSDTKTWFKVAYPSSYATSVFSSTSGPNDVAISNVNSQFLANYDIGTQNYGSDLSGAVLVPLWGLSSNDASIGYGQDDIKIHRHGWWDVSTTSKITFASFIGLPFQSSPNFQYSSAGGIVGDVSLNTTYLNITCSAPVVQTAADYPNGTLADSKMTINMTSPTTSETVNVHSPPATFEIWIRANATSKTLSSSCETRTVFLEMQIHCPGPFCAARKVRLTRGDDLPVNRSLFDDHKFGSAFFNELLISNGVPSGDFSADSSSFSKIESLIQTGFSDYVNVLYFPPDFVELPASSEDTYESFKLSTGMTRLINTYYQASLLPELNIQNNIYDIISGQTPSTNWALALFHGAVYDPHYHLSIPWITLDIMACTILLISAVRALRYRKRTIAPDIFGYISSLTRNNPDLDLPDGGSTLSGFERSRLMKHVKIKIADVSAEGNVGRVGLRHAGYAYTDAAAEHGAVEMAQLKRDRHYL